MSLTLKISARNLFRQGHRTVVSVLAVAVGVAVVVFARGWVEGVIANITESYFHYDTGHIRIVDAEYETAERVLSLRYTIDGLAGEGADAMVASLEEFEEVETALPRIKFGAMAAKEDELITMIGWGVDPSKEMEFTRIEDMIDKGRMVESGRREILMGHILMKDLNLEVGDRITIVYNTAYGSMGGATFEVSGRIRSPLQPLNAKIVYIPLDTARRLLHMDDESTEIILEASSMDKVRDIMPDLSAYLEKGEPYDRYKAIPWYESGTLAETIFMARYIYFFIYLFIVALAGFVVVNTMIMVVSERTREIGMMAALGMKREDILKVFVSEGMLKGLAGSLLGALLGGGITLLLSKTGIYLGDAGLMGEEILMSSVIYPVHSFSNMIFGFILGSLVVGLASYFPARKAASLQPAEALSEK